MSVETPHRFQLSPVGNENTEPEVDLAHFQLVPDQPENARGKVDLSRREFLYNTGVALAGGGLVALIGNTGVMVWDGITRGRDMADVRDQQDAVNSAVEERLEDLQIAVCAGDTPSEFSDVCDDLDQLNDDEAYLQLEYKRKTEENFKIRKALSMFVFGLFGAMVGGAVVAAANSSETTNAKK